MVNLYFGKNLRYLRKSKDLTQIKVGEVLDTTKNLITKYELGETNPSIETLIKIAEYFSVSVDDLLRSDLSVSGAGQGKYNSIPGIDLVSLARQVRHHSLDQLNQYLVKVGAIHCPDLYTHFRSIDQLKPTQGVIGEHSSDFLKLLRNAQRHEVTKPHRYELSLIRAEIDRIIG